MKRFLFLYPDNPTRLVLAKSQAWLDERGIQIIYADEEPQTDEELILPNYVRVDEVVKTVEAFAAPRAFDGLIVQTEYGLFPGAIVAERLGLRAITPDAAMRCANKWLCRQTLQRQGVAVPRFALCRTAEDVRRFGVFPCVFKGIASTMGRTVGKVTTDDDVEDRVERLRAELAEAPDIMRLQSFAKAANIDLGCDPLRQFLVEEFVEGPALETDGLVFGASVRHFGVTEQVLSRPPRFYIEGYLFPAEDNPGLEEVAEAALRALDVTDAGFSIEFRGRTVIEVNPRLGEDDGFPDLFKATRGSYPIFEWIDVERGRNRGRAAVAYANCYSNGVVREILGVPDIEVVVKPGQRMYAPPHPNVAPHLAYALRTDEKSSRAAYARARAAVDALLFFIE